MSTKTPRELLKEAQDEMQNEVTSKRLALLKSLDELDEIGGRDEYADSIEAILKEYPDGIPLSRVRSVFTDVPRFNEARKKLKEQKKIEESGLRANVLLKKA